MKKPRFKSTLALQRLANKRVIALVLAVLAVALQIIIQFDLLRSGLPMLRTLASLPDQSPTVGASSAQAAPEASASAAIQAVIAEAQRRAPRPTLTIPPPPGQAAPTNAVLAYASGSSKKSPNAATPASPLNTIPRPTLTVPPPPGVEIPKNAVLKYSITPSPGKAGKAKPGKPIPGKPVPGKPVAGTPVPGKTGTPGHPTPVPASPGGTPGVPQDLKRPLTPTDLLVAIIYLDKHSSLKLSRSQARQLIPIVKQLQSSYSSVWDANGAIYSVLTVEQLKWLKNNPPPRGAVPQGPPEQVAQKPAETALKSLTQ